MQHSDACVWPYPDDGHSARVSLIKLPLQSVYESVFESVLESVFERFESVFRRCLSRFVESFCRVVFLHGGSEAAF